jgi:hypothetical protein
MKRFEIGNGATSICVPDHYCAEFIHEDNTTVLRNSDVDLDILINVFVVEPEDQIAKIWQEKGNKIIELGDRACVYRVQRLEADDLKAGESGFWQHVFEVKYDQRFFILSVTSPEERLADSFLAEITSAIQSMEKRASEDFTILAPLTSDFAMIARRVASILGIQEAEIEAYHARQESLAFIQQVIDNEKYAPDEEYEWQSLGLAWGDYLRHHYPDYHWAVVRDEYGRELCLQYRDLHLNIFPMSMLLKRVEEGEAVDARELIRATLATIEEVAREHCGQNLP